MKKAFLLITLSILSINIANAALNGLSIHSRANCINNESITWDATSYHVVATAAAHYYNGVLIHYVMTGWENTWRSAAVHWGEGKGGWKVDADHWIRTDKDRYLGRTTVTDCSIYDGWWDYNRA